MKVEVNVVVIGGVGQNPYFGNEEFEGAVVFMGEDWITVSQGVGVEEKHTYFRADTVWKITQIAEVEAPV